MSEAVQLELVRVGIPAFFGLLTLIAVALTNKYLGGKVDRTSGKVDETIKLGNSVLTHTTEKKEEAEQKLEQVKTDRLTVLETQLAEANRTIALLTNPKKD